MSWVIQGNVLVKIESSTSATPSTEVILFLKLDMIFCPFIPPQIEVPSLILEANCCLADVEMNTLTPILGDL